MAFTQTPAANDPVSTMNMTPLIDVLLVLLVMFIITIPIASHSIDFDLPSTPIEPVVIPDPVSNKIVVSQGNAILWNGEEVSKAQLVALLRVSSNMVPEPELQFEPEALASYQTSAQVLRTIKFSGVTKFGFVGTERYRQFD